jgi:predicted ATPase
MAPPSIQRVVLTGGPCAGKSTALRQLADWLRAADVQVFHVHEASTLLLSAGIHVAGQSLERMVAFQRGIVQVQLALEEAFLHFARHQDRHAVLLCDRGVLDGAAYLPPAAWAEVLRELGLREIDLLRRYDAVIHLVTAAYGAEGHYGTQSNAVRYENVEEARGVDDRLRLAWRDHPNQRLIDNATGLEEKMRRVLHAVSDVVGVPGPG